MLNKCRHEGAFRKMSAALACLVVVGATHASEIGITDSEIVIGGSVPLSGPNGSYAPIGYAHRACYDAINADGGIKMGDGKTRKVKFVMYDDAMEPARALQNARRLITQDKVFAVVGTGGTGANLGVRPYYNAEKVPQAFIGSGGPMFGAKDEVAKFPWTILGYPAYNTEAALYAAFIKERFPNAKIALLNDDSGGPFFAKGFLKAAKELGLNLVIHEEHSYSEATIDAKIDRIAASGADLFVEATTPKFAAQAIKRMKAINWKPTHFIWGVGSSISGTLQPAGVEISKGIYTGLWLKDQASVAYANDADMKSYVAGLKKYNGSLQPADQNAAAGWYFCQVTKAVLERTKTPTREAFMEAARNLDHVRVPMLIDGITLTTNGASDGYPIESMQMGQFDGVNFAPVGAIVSYEGKTPAP